MSDQDLFNEDKDKPTDNDQDKATPTPNQQNQSPDYNQMLGMIVNAEGKPKYSTVEDALKGASHAQVHIANLEQELAALKANGDNSRKIDDVINALQSQSQETPNSDDGQLQLSATDIQNLVKNAVKDINSQTTKEQNIKEVTGKFRELYGDKASETLYSKAEDLGMSKEDINSLIAKNPTAAFRVLGVDTQAKPDIDPIKGDVNTENFQHRQEPEIKSSMGYVSTKTLTDNWLASKKKTNKRLGLEET